MTEEGLKKLWSFVEKNWINLLIVYVVIGLLTFGTSWNASLNCDPLPKNWTTEEWSAHWHCTRPLSGFRGLFWPFIWIGEIAIWITR